MFITKDHLKQITQTMNAEQAQYVAGMNDIITDIHDNAPELIEKGQDIDIVYIAKIMAFADKFKNLHWAAVNMEYHKVLDDFGKELESYKDDIAENIQSIIGQFNGEEMVKLTLPLGKNPLDIINELKICIHNWYNAHNDNIEYEGCRSLTSTFLEVVHKYIYLFRLCKING